MSDLTRDFKYYDYYFECYSAVLSNFIGDFSVEKELEDGSRAFVNSYGLKAFFALLLGVIVLVIMMILVILVLMVLRGLTLVMI